MSERMVGYFCNSESYSGEQTSRPVLAAIFVLNIFFKVLLGFSRSKLVELNQATGFFSGAPFRNKF